MDKRTSHRGKSIPAVTRAKAQWQEQKGRGSTGLELPGRWSAGRQRTDSKEAGELSAAERGALKGYKKHKSVKIVATIYRILVTRHCSKRFPRINSVLTASL